MGDSGGEGKVSAEEETKDDSTTVEEVEVGHSVGVTQAEVPAGVGNHLHNPRQDSFDDDLDDDSSDGGSEEEDDQQDEEEGEEEEEENEEEESGESLEETEEAVVSAGKTQEEIEAELEEMQTILINEYILLKGKLKYERKRNAYFQDRIYRTSVRKGIIVESQLEDESGLGKSKKKRRCRPTDRNAYEGVSSEEEESIGLDDISVEGEEEEGETKRRRRHRRHKRNKEEEGPVGGRRGFIGEKFANEAKYQKLLRKIMKLQRSKANYAVQHQATLQVHSDKCREWSELHVSCINRLLDEIRFQSEVAVDSNTGKRMSKHETEEYCGEVLRIHRKFCETMLKMYKSRRGLEFTLKRLKESEIQEGEEIEILEFEQLKDENSTLKDKLGDRIKDIENIKAKISYAIQILAHIRNKMNNMSDNIGDGEDELIRINEEVYAAKAKTEEVLLELVQKRREERALVVDSGLLDNPTLLRDYEETLERVGNLKETKKSLERKMVEGNRELEEMQDRTTELKNHYPALFATANLDSRGIGLGDAKVEGRFKCNSGLPYTCQPKPCSHY